MLKRVAKWTAVAVALAGAVALPLAAAGKRPHISWTGGGVSSDGSIAFRALAGKKYLVTASRNVTATAEGVDLQHADKATAEVSSKLEVSTIKANGDVRFIVRKAGKGQTDKANGRCDQVTIYNPGDKKPTGTDRILVADLVGNVSLSLVRIEAPAAGKTASAEEPMTLEGEHARVWLTEEGLEGSIEGGE